MTEMFIEIRIYTQKLPFRERCLLLQWLFYHRLFFTFQLQTTKNVSNAANSWKTYEDFTRTADANLCMKFNTLLFGDLVTHVNHWRHVHKAPLYFSSTIFETSQVSKTKDIGSRIFWSNCLYPQRFKPDFFEKPLRYRKIKFRNLHFSDSTQLEIGNRT